MKYMIVKNNLLLAAVLLAGAATTARAQITLLNDNLDSYSGAAPSFSFGDAANPSANYVSGAGVGGSVGLVGTIDINNGPNYYAGFAVLEQANLTGNTSTSLSDYTLSFDAQVNLAGGGFTLIVQNFAGADFAGQTGTGVINLYPTAPNAFSHFTVNLGDLVTNPYDAFTVLGNPSGASIQIGWELQSGVGTMAAPSTGNVLVVDNVQLTMVPVPEPSSLALCALGGLGFIRCLVRRNAKA
jgi:hypothetical protein